jgi:hypothetical protein
MPDGLLVTVPVPVAVVGLLTVSVYKFEKVALIVWLALTSVNVLLYEEAPYIDESLIIDVPLTMSWKLTIW